MGSGKSYVGARLALLLGLPFIDLDERIESAAGKSISAIFANEGEGMFREYERQALRACEKMEAAVIATGGGTPCFHEGMDWMNAHGITVFLDPTLSILLARLEHGREHRPLLQTQEAFRENITRRLDARRPIYEKAQLQLRVTDPKADVARYLYEYLSPGE